MSQVGCKLKLNGKMVVLALRALWSSQVCRLSNRPKCKRHDDKKKILGVLNEIRHIPDIWPYISGMTLALSTNSTKFVNSFKSKKQTQNQMVYDIILQNMYEAL